MDQKTAIAKLKKLPFYKSWQNTYITKSQNIIDFKTGRATPTDLGVFVYIPATTVLQLHANDRDFLSFRLENKNSDAYEYNLITDRFENNNRRIAVMFMAEMLKQIDIKFLIDDAYTLYIPNEELQKLGSSDDNSLREFYNSLYIPKNFVGRKGTTETWSN